MILPYDKYDPNYHPRCDMHHSNYQLKYDIQHLSYFLNYDIRYIITPDHHRNYGIQQPIFYFKCEFCDQENYLVTGLSRSQGRLIGLCLHAFKLLLEIDIYLSIYLNYDIYHPDSYLKYYIFIIF